MPHKHTRRDKDDSTYDLPPNQIARPLPVLGPKQLRQTTGKGNGKGKGKGGKGNNAVSAEQNTQGIKRKRGASEKDDAPRAFKRLMALAEGKRPKNGLDNGRPLSKKEKKKRKADGENPAPAKEATEPKKEIPTIRPGERISEFSARVDAALPVMGLVAKGTKGGKDPLGLKVHRTRKEKQMHKLYDEWRREEAEIQDKRREEREEAEEKEMDNEGTGVKWRLDMEGEGAASHKKKKKGKKGRSVWETDDKEDDPWEELKKKRGETKIGLHDVVKAPPVFKTIPTQVLKVGGAAVEVGSIPKSAGSLKRREELQTVREEVVANYRKMMEGKRARMGENDA